jgi:hypothetical protein
MTWEQVGQDYNEAIRRRAAKEHELLLEAREQSAQPDTTLKAPTTLEEHRRAFLAMKRKDQTGRSTRPPARTGARPDWMEPFARTIDAAKKYVVSSTLDRVDWNAELVRGI